jgi:hypothetical protein
MNWYGGSLHRHSKPSERFGNRNYISSARRFNHVQSTDHFSMSNFIPSYLRPEVSSDAGRMPKRQRTLNEFPNVAPLVHRLDSMKNGGKKSISTSRSRDSRLVHVRKKDVVRHAAGSSSNRPIIIEEIGENLDSDIDNPAEGNDLNSNEPAETVQQRRLQLLNQQDWAGLKYIRPVHMDFAKCKQRPLQRPRAVHEERYDKEFKTREPFKRQHTVEGESSGEFYMTGALRVDTSSINVKIGKDALQSTLDSDIGEEKLTCYPHHDLSNELMLLENKDHIQPTRMIKAAQETLFDEYTLPESQLPTIRSSIWRPADSPDSRSCTNMREFAIRDQQIDSQKKRSIHHDGDGSTQSSKDYTPPRGEISLNNTGYDGPTVLARNPSTHPSALAFHPYLGSLEKGRITSIPRFGTRETHSAPRIKLLASNIHGAATDALTQAEPAKVALTNQLGGLDPTKVSNGNMQSAQCIAGRRNDQSDAYEDVVQTMPRERDGVLRSPISTPSGLDEIESMVARPEVPTITELKDDDEDAIWQRFVFGDNRPSTVSARGSNRATSIANHQGISSESANLTGLSTRVNPDIDIVPSSSPPWGLLQVRHTLTSIMPTHQLGLQAAI